MSQIAHTLPTRTQLSAVDTHAEPCSDGVGERDALLPEPSEAQAQAVQLPLAQMAALLTARTDELPFLDDVEPESDSEVSIVQSAVVTVPPPLMLAARVRTSAPPPPERAELQLEDLSLRMDNPYRASSLVPPPAKAPRKGFLISLCAAAAGAIIGFASVGHLPFGLGEHAAEQISRGRAQPAAHVVPVAAPIAQVVVAPILAAVATPSPALPSAVEVVAVAAPTPAPAMRAAAPARASRAAMHSSSRARKVRKPRGKKAPAVASAAPVAEAAAQLPRSPSRQQIIAGFGQLRGEFQRCAAGKHGVAEINARILNSGRVSRPHIAGEFENSPASLCMERAVRNFSFAPFSEPEVRVQFPVSI